jgi:hypothetical protein
MNAQSTPPPAILHTPGELLDTARELLGFGNQKLYRGAVLEALASLEAFIQLTIFPSLRQRFSEDFSTWLEKRTRMDLDSRLSILSPIATGVPVDTSSTMWSKYKQTREIRNSVAHGGRKVTKAQAQAVIDMAAEWMAYLGSTIELENALLELKQWVESQVSSPVRSEKDGVQIIVEFFSRTKATKSLIEQRFQVNGIAIQADAVLDFGAKKVLIETKFAHGKRKLRSLIDTSRTQIDRIREITGITQACLVIFADSWEEDVPTVVEKHSNGDVFTVVIRI